MKHTRARDPGLELEFTLNPHHSVPGVNPEHQTPIRLRGLEIRIQAHTLIRIRGQEFMVEDSVEQVTVATVLPDMESVCMVPLGMKVINEQSET
mmetsp:Transcript_41144/g.64279  ORF Transcript_41144/g.64279 Transcript_41144/m.64279 type:complete len:94 (-) Transcript_41144:10-291(-)